jgi:hypothetical protein
MSYCRWSTDLFRCDVYVYESDEGWVTHVAGRKLKHSVPPEIDAMPQTTFKESWARDRAYAAWRDTLPSDEVPVSYLQADGTTRDGLWRSPKDSEYEDLPEPWAGETYVDATPGACADRLEVLRGRGFQVPQSAIDSLRAETP